MDVEEGIELPSMETTVEELEKRDRELKANNGVPNVLTPLIEFVLAKKMEKFRLREEKREEKRKKEMERKEKKRRQKKLFTAAKVMLVSGPQHFSISDLTQASSNAEIFLQDLDI